MPALTCPECGSGMLIQTTVNDLASLCPPAKRRHAHEMLALLDVQAALTSAWLCGRCFAMGVTFDW